MHEEEYQLIISDAVSSHNAKRQQEDPKPLRSDGDSSSDDKRRRMIPRWKDAIRKVIKLQRNLQHFSEPVLEPLIRRVVREEVELAFKKYLTGMKWTNGKETQTSKSKRLQLKFSSMVALPVFTGTRIEGVEGDERTSLKLCLVDAATGEIVSSGPESSARVEIVALEGDFDGDDGNNLMNTEFQNNVVKERNGKKPLLTGDVCVCLDQGISSVGEISFTDNSSWTRSRKFRLGAKIVDNFDGVTVTEAKTESFIVRDHRGELYKKHYPPALTDEVWRLEKIGKGGAFHMRLNKEKVHTVKDFLIQFFLNSTGLRNMLGAGMSNKMWEVTVDHARTCVLDNRLHLYGPPESQERTIVVFDVVGQVKGLLSEGQYIPVDKLSDTEKVDAHNLVVSAFDNLNEVVSVDDEASLMDGASLVLDSLNSTMIESSSGSKTFTPQNSRRFDYQQLHAPSPDIMPSICSMVGFESLEDYGLHDTGCMDVKLDQHVDFSNCLGNSLMCGSDIIDQGFSNDEHLDYFDTDCSFGASSLKLNGDTRTAERYWKMLCSVLRWWFSIRRIMARKSRDVENT